MTHSFQLPGYEHLELSTQLIIREAFSRELKVEVLDEADQLIRISGDGRTEYIQEATRTSADSYITGFLLGNKWVGKRILKEAGVAVPEGKLYSIEAAALADFPHFQEGQWVVKPKTTNFGVGITLLSENVIEDDFRVAVARAFSEDETIIIERFVPGIECRFLVIGDECVAVLHRVPANVVGDGQHTISQLVEIKNTDPRRGTGYRTPLEKIALGDVELAELASQGLTLDSVPEHNQQIFLRRNSNISTGGDSIDYTDKVHPDYKAIAVKAAHAVGSNICGVDIILSDFSSSPSPTNHGVIELNYNPVLYFHDYPFEGENRHTARYVLDLLGF